MCNRSDSSWLGKFYINDKQCLKQLPNEKYNIVEYKYKMLAELEYCVEECGGYLKVTFR